MTVTATSAASATSGASTASGRDYSTLGQADFLRLLTAQLQQQDPTDPVDNKEMLAQMAQFSSVAGITDVNATLTEISAKLDTLAAATASASATSTD